MTFWAGFFIGFIYFGGLFFTAGMCGLNELEDDAE